MPIQYKDDGAVKRPDKKMGFDRAMLLNYAQCAKSIEYFSEKFYHIIAKNGKQLIKLRTYQKKMIETFQKEKNVIILSSRQSGKTTTVGIYALWYAMYNKDKTIAILANKADMAKAILLEIKDAYEEIPEYLKPGVKEYNAHSVIFDNGCKILARATSPNAIRGETVNLLILDEFAFVDQHVADPFYTSNYPTLSSTDGQCIIISTPNGTGNLFFDLWQKAQRGENTYVPIRVDWWEVEGRDEAWKEKMIKNMGVIKFNQEFGNKFAGSVVTLIDADYIIKNLKGVDPIAQPDEYTKIWEYPKKDRKYLISIDTAGGVGSDYSVMNVFDITDCPFGSMRQVATYRRNTITPPAFADMLFDSLEVWNDAYLIGEINGLSNEVLTRIQERDYTNIYYDYEDESFGIYSDRSSKPKAAVWFKDELENGRIELNDVNTIEEIGYFEEVRPGVYKAKSGRNNHDDMVMTCIWAVLFIKSQYFLDEKEDWGKDEPWYDDDTSMPDGTSQETEQLGAFLNDAQQEIDSDNDNWLQESEMQRFNKRN
jgi:hypothetical protein